MRRSGERCLEVELLNNCCCVDQISLEVSNTGCFSPSAPQPDTQSGPQPLSPSAHPSFSHSAIQSLSLSSLQPVNLSRSVGQPVRPSRLKPLSPSDTHFLHEPRVETSRRGSTKTTTNFNSFLVERYPDLRQGEAETLKLQRYITEGLKFGKADSP